MPTAMTLPPKKAVSLKSRRKQIWMMQFPMTMRSQVKARAQAVVTPMGKAPVGHVGRSLTPNSDRETDETSTKAEQSDSGDSSSSLESDEHQTIAAPPIRKTQKRNCNTSQTLSLPNLDGKASEEDRRVQQCKDACLLDKNFGEWWDHMIQEGHKGWEMCDQMTCDHADPCKEANYPDLISLPLEYMKHCGVFDAKKTKEYDLCWFYQVGLSGDLPGFPSPHEPDTHEWMVKFLCKARALGQPNLVVIHSQDSMTAICLLQELHEKDSLRHLPMELKTDARGKAIKKLSFCLFCMYLGCNDPLYLNHIICGHYNTNYGCGKCLNKVFTMGQPLRAYIKTCKGLPKEATDSAPISPKKCMSKDPSSDSQLLPPWSSQESSQESLCQSQHPKKKLASTSKKSDSNQKEEECSSHHKHHGNKSSTDKPSGEQSKKMSHIKSKKSSKKSSKDAPSQEQSKDKCHEKDKRHDQDKVR